MKVGVVNKTPIFKIYSVKKKNRKYREFLNKYVLPYLKKCGFEEVPFVYPKTDIIYLRNGDYGVVCSKKLFKNHCYFIVTEKENIIGTIVYDRVYPLFYSYLFYMDFFAIFNRELAKEIKEFTYIEKFYEDMGLTITEFSRSRTKPLGDNLVSRRVHYTNFYYKDKIKNEV